MSRTLLFPKHVHNSAAYHQRPWPSMACILAVAAMLLGAVSAATPGSAAPAFQTPGDVLAWIDRYRDDPRPKEVPAAVKAMSRLGLFSGQDEAALYIGFVAGVIGSNQVLAPKLIAEMIDLPPEQHAVVVKAIAFSGLPEWQDLLTRFSDRMPARSVLIVKYLLGEAKPLDQLELDAEPNLLDTHWGYYFATGYYGPVAHIIGGLDWSADVKDVDRLTIGSMAKWTLAANAARNQDLLRFYYAQLPHRGDKVAEPLKDVISAVEDFDPGRIRREATKSLEELKRRGPDTGGDWTRYFTKAGSTAISLACVAATATGHPEIAAPCVIAGALYTAGSSLYFDAPWNK